jgi:hypothetical protein
MEPTSSLVLLAPNMVGNAALCVNMSMCYPPPPPLGQQNIRACMRRLWAQLLQHWGRPVPPLPDASELAASKLAATAANLASRVHQADLASRAMLNAALEHVHKVGAEARRNGCVCVGGGGAANHQGAPSLTVIPWPWVRWHHSGTTTVSAVLATPTWYDS